MVRVANVVAWSEGARGHVMTARCDTSSGASRVVSQVRQVGEFVRCRYPTVWNITLTVLVVDFCEPLVHLAAALGS